MNIILITDSYPPEIRSASHLMQELAEGLRDRGHDITVLTTYPQYNLAAEIKDVCFPEFSVEDTIHVVRISTLPHHKVNFIVRGISQILMPYIFISKIRKYLKKADVVIVYSPPLTLVKVGAFIKRRYGARFILNVQDIFPQNAIDLGVLTNRFLINYFETLEKKAYEMADKIVVHSEGNADFIVHKRNAPSSRVSILHNWIDLKQYSGITRTNYFREKYGLANKFIILFAGVIGPSQGLDFVIRVAEQVNKNRDICFLIVGDGMEKKKLISLTEQKGLRNVVFKPFVSKEEYPMLVKDADIGLVSLTARNKTPVVPGKILGYMASGIPVIAYLNKESGGHEIISDARCGFSAVPCDPVSAGELILKIYRDKDQLKKFGDNGFNYVSENFEKRICLDKLEVLLGGSNK